MRAGTWPQSRREAAHPERCARCSTAAAPRHYRFHLFRHRHLPWAIYPWKLPGRKCRRRRSCQGRTPNHGLQEIPSLCPCRCRSGVDAAKSRTCRCGRTGLWHGIRVRQRLVVRTRGRKMCRPERCLRRGSQALHRAQEERRLSTGVWVQQQDLLERLFPARLQDCEIARRQVLRA
jgi:hypothetical protein